MSYSKGDKVLLNGGVVAEIVNYDEGANVIVLKATPYGGGEDIITAHISNTRIEPLETQTFAEVHEAKPGKSKRSGVTNSDEPAPQVLVEDEVAGDDESA